MHRRDFLKRSSKATALAAVTGLTGFYFYDREPWQSAPIVLRQPPSFEVAADPSLPKVTLATNEDHVSALRASLVAIGGIKRFIKPGDRVTIKPNVGWDRSAAQAANTSPILVGEMVRLVKEAGASEIIVTDVTCNEARRCFLRSGIRKAVEKQGSRIVLAEKDDFIETNLNGLVLTRWPVLKYFLDTDKLINMPIIKHHSLTSVTVGMKNLYGIIGGRRNQLHQQIDQSIVDLTNFAKPTLTVVDGTRVLMRGGPQGGSLDDVELRHTVICATDPVAADSKAVEFLGLRGEQVSHIVLAYQSGLGELDYNLAGYKEIA